MQPRCNSVQLGGRCQQTKEQGPTSLHPGQQAGPVPLGRFPRWPRSCSIHTWMTRCFSLLSTKPPGRGFMTSSRRPDSGPPRPHVSRGPHRGLPVAVPAHLQKRSRLARTAQFFSALLWPEKQTGENTTEYGGTRKYQGVSSSPIFQAYLKAPIDKDPIQLYWSRATRTHLNTFNFIGPGLLTVPASPWNLLPGFL